MSSDSTNKDSPGTTTTSTDNISRKDLVILRQYF